jgi:hypothetical protein
MVEIGAVVRLFRDRKTELLSRADIVSHLVIDPPQRVVHPGKSVFGWLDPGAWLTCNPWLIQTCASENISWSGV